MTRDRDTVAGPVSIAPERDDLTLLSFLDRHFDGVPGLAEEFPLLLGSDNLDRRLCVHERGRLVAHAAWRPVALRSPRGPIRAAGIGLVTTHAERRGRGLATRVVESCVERARAEGCELALLFGHTRELYRRLGFVPAGRERITHLSHTLEAESAKIRPGEAQDAGVLLALLERQPLGVERSLGELRALLAIPGVSVWCLEQADRVVAYCVEGKGRDLSGVIHEWAGPPESVRRLLAGVLPDFEEIRYLLSPEVLAPPVPGEHSIGPLAQMRILAPERFGSDDPRRVFGDASSPASWPVYLWGLDSL